MSLRPKTHCSSGWLHSTKEVGCISKSELESANVLKKFTFCIFVKEDGK